jgi:hypothetical protein
VVLRQESEPVPAQEDLLSFIDKARKRMEEAGCHFMDDKEMAAHLEWLREGDWVDDLLRQADGERARACLKAPDAFLSSPTPTEKVKKIRPVSRAYDAFLWGPYPSRPPSRHRESQREDDAEGKKVKAKVEIHPDTKMPKRSTTSTRSRPTRNRAGRRDIPEKGRQRPPDQARPVSTLLRPRHESPCWARTSCSSSRRPAGHQRRSVRVDIDPTGKVYNVQSDLLPEKALAKASRTLAAAARPCHHCR